MQKVSDSRKYTIKKELIRVARKVFYLSCIVYIRNKPNIPARYKSCACDDKELKCNENNGADEHHAFESLIALDVIALGSDLLDMTTFDAATFNIVTSSSTAVLGDGLFGIAFVFALVEVVNAPNTK